MVRKVSFYAKRPVKKTVCFKARGKRVCFKARTPQKVKISFYVKK